jgi:hypothetical protein
VSEGGTFDTEAAAVALLLRAVEIARRDYDNIRTSR